MKHTDDMENTWIFPLRSLRQGGRTVWLQFDGPEIYEEDVEILIEFLKVAKKSAPRFNLKSRTNNETA